MGLFGIGKKKKEGEFLGHLTMPDKPKSEGEITSFGEIGAPSPPIPLAPPETETHDSTQVVDEKSSFEIPDFSEEDLNFEIPIEKELMMEEPTKEEPESKPEPEPEVEEEPKVEKPQVELDEELPEFELGGIMDKSSLAEELPEKEVHFQKEDSRYIKTKIEVYVERNHYLDTLSREEEVIDGIKQIRLELNNITKYADKEEKLFKEIMLDITKLKDQIIGLDSKIFEQG